MVRRVRSAIINIERFPFLARVDAQFGEQPEELFRKCLVSLGSEVLATSAIAPVSIPHSDLITIEGKGGFLIESYLLATE